MARHMGKHIPGAPSVLVQNMPGAASLIAANYIYARAPRDGSVFGLIDRGLPLMAVVKSNPNVQFDPAKFTWLGSSSNGADDGFVLMTRKDAQARSLDDIRRKGGPNVRVGVTAIGATDTEAAKLLRDVVRLNIQIVSGYRSGNDINLAVDQGEVDARPTTYSSLFSTKPDWLKQDGNMHILVVMGRDTRMPQYPNIPLARELVSDPKDKDLVDLADMPFRAPWPWAAPPEVPADRAKALREAFLNTSKDVAYRAEATKLTLDVTPMDGADVLAMIKRASEFAPDVLERMRALQNNEVSGEKR
ncbi:MAG: tripartite tricarboxylate transporter substrate-binding protein [Beijerinckiaceae bacterium]|nr:tripartite tricarboxylate transporter substrate-binding protein [Beijerinckiaceae bacterium]